jgi:glycosyltransferase involved in cell wall biosynthesis
MEKTKILYVHSSNELYGADRSLLRLVRNLDKRQYSPFVVISSDVNYEKQLLSPQMEELGVETFILPLAVLRRKYFNPIGLIYFCYLLIISSWNLSRIIRKYRINIVHSNTSAVFSGSVAAYITKRVHFWHVREIYITPRLSGWIIARLINLLSTKAIAVSNAVRENLTRNGCDPNKIAVIHNGIDVECFSPDEMKRNLIRSEFEIPQSAIVIGMIGRISSWKGQDILVLAAKEIVESFPEVQFLLVGGVVEWEEFRRDDLISLINESGLSESIILEDFRSDVPDLLTAFDIFVLPSTLPDPYPTVVLEAMASGLPVIASAQGGSMEMVSEDCGILVPAGDPRALAASINDLIKNTDIRISMGQKSMLRAQQKFSTQSYVDSIESVYSEVIS